MLAKARFYAFSDMLGDMPKAARPSALVFDLDGTLWDTCATCAGAWNEVLARLAIPYREIIAADVRAVAGRAHAEAIRQAFPDLSEERVASLVEETAVADNRAIAEHGGELFPGVAEHVPRLAARFPLLIVSNCQKGYVELFREWSGLGRHFVDFECWGNTGRTKAENLRALIDRNGLRSPWLIGDTEGDAKAARDNGVRFVYASYGFGDVTRFDERIDHFADLTAQLDGAE